MIVTNCEIAALIPLYLIESLSGNICVIYNHCDVCKIVAKLHNCSNKSIHLVTVQIYCIGEIKLELLHHPVGLTFACQPTLHPSLIPAYPPKAHNFWVRCAVTSRALRRLQFGVHSNAVSFKRKLTASGVKFCPNYAQWPAASAPRGIRDARDIRLWHGFRSRETTKKTGKPHCNGLLFVLRENVN